MKNNTIILTIIVALVVGAAAFFAGMKYQQSKQPQRQFGQGTQRSTSGANRGSFRPINGEIITADDKTITVKLQDGSSKIVLLGNNTTINKSDAATKSDLKTGEKVAVFGTDNSDGSVTAQNIQLNPQFRGGGGPDSSNSPSPR